MSILEYIFSILIIYFIILSIRRHKSIKNIANRYDFITDYQFPEAVFRKVKEKYPHLTDEHLQQVNNALRQYFTICNKADRQLVSMPSQVVDVAWHEFILFTRQYQQFCGNAFGYFLHHTPTEAMETPTKAQEGIKRTWSFACDIEKIASRKPNRLPLIFGIDAALSIPDGFIYHLDCSLDSTGSGYCAIGIGCSGGGGGGSGGSGCGGDSDSGSSSSCSSGGGCGGGGCGGS